MEKINKQETELVQIKHFTTLKEGIKVDINEFLNMKEDINYIDLLLEKNIEDFDYKYDIAWSTNIKVHNILYRFPVLTDKNHKKHIYPNVIWFSEGSVEINFHEHKMAEVPKKES